MTKAEKATRTEERRQREFDKLYETYGAGIELAPSTLQISHYWASRMAKAAIRASMDGISKKGYYFDSEDINGTELAFGVTVVKRDKKYFLNYQYNSAISDLLEYWLNFAD